MVSHLCSWDKVSVYFIHILLADHRAYCWPEFGRLLEYGILSNGQYVLISIRISSKTLFRYGTSGCQSRYSLMTASSFVARGQKQNSFLRKLLLWWVIV